MVQGQIVIGILVALGASGSLAHARQNPLIRGQQAPNDLKHATALGTQGTLTIQAVQGTEGGSPVGGEDVEITLYHREQPVQQIASKLDENGELVVENIPVSLGVRALVRIQHAGVYYVEVSELMDNASPTDSVEIPVFEATDDRQPHEIVVRQLAGALVTDGIDVAETVVIENSGDRTWMGEPADADGRRATLRLTLPPDAVELELIQGFHGWCCSEYTPPILTVQMPMMPGQNAYRFAYKIPVRSGQSDMRIASGAATKHSVFVVPADDVVATGAGAEEVDGELIGSIQTMKFEGGPHDPDEVVGIMLSEVALPQPETAAFSQSPSPATGGDKRWAYWGTGIGAFVVVVVAGVFVRRSITSG